MAKTIMLSAGGIRSLVALAALRSQPHVGDLVLLHLTDGRGLEDHRAEHVHRQARHFKVNHVMTAPLPVVAAGLGSDHEADEPSRAKNDPPMLRPQILVAACAFAFELQASRIVWPAQANGLYSISAAINEQLVLVRHLAQFDDQSAITIDTPLLDMTDRQLIELGSQLSVPWHLAWSCVKSDTRSCGECPGCRRRKSGFEAAGIVDATSESSDDLKQAG